MTSPTNSNSKQTISKSNSNTNTAATKTSQSNTNATAGTRYSNSSSSGSHVHTASSKTSRDTTVLGVRTEPEWKYVWNKHLLKDVVTTLHADWLLYVVHGFISQSNIQVFGKSLYLALIARRSNQFAGECAASE